MRIGSRFELYRTHLRIGNWLLAERGYGLLDMKQRTLGTAQQWRGPHIRIGELRIDFTRTILRYKAIRAEDMVKWTVSVYWPRPNSYEGDRIIRGKGWHIDGGAQK